ncbi:MAG: hypothetical protein ACRD2C_06375 [Acidimicrobiales bacterium]
MLHILSVVAAFAPAFSYALWTRRLSQDDPGLLQRIYTVAAPNERRVNATALVLAGLFGLVLVARNDQIFKFDQAWVNLAILTWFAMSGVLHGMLLPAERKVARGDVTAADRVDLGGMILSLLAVFMLYLMVWKPGL